MRDRERERDLEGFVIESLRLPPFLATCYQRDSVYSIVEDEGRKNFVTRATSNRIKLMCRDFTRARQDSVR